METLVSLLQDSTIATAIREGDILFPLIETIHVLALCLVVGSIMVVDLRLLGFATTDSPVQRVINAIIPVTLCAFAVAVGAGGLLFISKAGKYLENGFFLAKLALIGAAGVNMAFFHLVTARGLAEWGQQPKPPPGARIAGGVSLLLWISVVACGRCIGFTMPME